MSGRAVKGNKVQLCAIRKVYEVNQGAIFRAVSLTIGTWDFGGEWV